MGSLTTETRAIGDIAGLRGPTSCWQAGVTLSAFIARFKRREAIAAQPSGDYTSSCGFLQRRARS
jgi:hypothetical protein